MRKQMGKKAIKTALAASVVVSAVAIPASALAASTTIDQYSYTSIDKWIEDMNDIYDNLDNNQAQAIKSLREKITNDESGISWDEILTTVDFKFDNVTEDGLKDLTKKLSAIFFSETQNELKSNIDAFREAYTTSGMDAELGDVTANEFLGMIAKAQTLVLNEYVNYYNVNGNLNLSNDEIKGIYTRSFGTAILAFSTQHTDIQDNVTVKLAELVGLASKVQTIVTGEQAAYDAIITALEKEFNERVKIDNGGSTGGSGGSGGGGGTVTKPTQPGNVGGPVVSAPVTKVETPQGTKVVAKVDDNKIADLISKGEIKDKVAITIENAKGEIAEAVVSTNAIQALLKNNPNTVIQIATSDATYNLPANEINVQALATALGVAVGDVEISIQVNTVAAPSSLAGNNLVSPVLEFTIVARSGDKSVTIDKFTTYVERQVVASKDVNSKNIVAVRINADSSLSPVPTLTDGNRITFKSNSNSKYTVVENDVTFADVQSSWAKNDIETLANKLIIKGVDDNKFAPKAETTRAQVAVLLTRALGLQGQKATKVSFKDVKGNEWFAGDLAVAVEAGLVGGYEDGTFKANKTITRQEAAAMIKRAMDFAKYDQAALQGDKKASSLYKDYTSIGNWAKNDIEVITQAGIMGGDEKGEFNPTNNTTREQLASILKRFMTFVKFTN